VHYFALVVKRDESSYFKYGGKGEEYDELEEWREELVSKVLVGESHSHGTHFGSPYTLLHRLVSAYIKNNISIALNTDLRDFATLVFSPVFVVVLLLC